MTENEFINTICDYPDDLFPRLAFADWLEENATSNYKCAACDGMGDYCWSSEDGGSPIMVCPDCRGKGSVSDGRSEMAEFIRVQVELATVKKTSCGEGEETCVCKRESELRIRERELFGPIKRTFGDSLGIDFSPTVDMQWSRGFVEGVACSVSQWKAHGPEMVRKTPILKVVLTDNILGDTITVIIDTSIPWCFVPSDGSKFKCATDGKAAIRWARSETRDGKLRKMP